MGALNLGLNLGLTAFLHEVVHAPAEVAYGVGLITIFILNFFLSRHYIYDDASGGDPRGQLVRFVVTSGGFRVLEYGAFLILHSVLGVYYLAAAVAVQVTSFLAKFAIFRGWVFVGGDRNA